MGKKWNPVNEGRLIVIWQDGEELSWPGEHKRGHGFDLRITNRKEGKEYSMCLGAEFKTLKKKILVKYYGTKERRKIKAMKKNLNIKRRKLRIFVGFWSKDAMIKATL